MDKTKKEHEIMASNAQILMQESQEVLRQAMAECNIEGFQSVSLNIPQVIQGESGVVDLADQEQVWQQINQLYASQESLYDQASPSDDNTKEPNE